MKNGWIKLHRKLLDNPVISKPNYNHLWILLLLMANHTDKKITWNGEFIFIKEGQILTGRDELVKKSHLPATTIERILKYLENGHQIGQQKTTKYRIITILNWKEYQNMDIKTDNKRTTNGQQTDTNNNVNNEKNEKKLIISEQSSQEIPQIIDLFKEVNPAYKKWFGNKTQRAAVDRMLKEMGFEKLSQSIKLLPKTNTMRFAPVITTPLQLEDKMAQFISFLLKKKGEIPALIKIR